jgi:hypothetical protein
MPSGGQHRRIDIGALMRLTTAGLIVTGGLGALLLSRVYLARSDRIRFSRLQELLDNDPYL